MLKMAVMMVFEVMWSEAIVNLLWGLLDSIFEDSSVLECILYWFNDLQSRMNHEVGTKLSCDFELVPPNDSEFYN